MKYKNPEEGRESQAMDNVCFKTVPSLYKKQQYLKHKFFTLEAIVYNLNVDFCVPEFHLRESTGGLSWENTGQTQH